MSIEQLPCPNAPNCGFLKQGLDWCNRLPIWYETEDRSIAVCMKSLMLERNKDHLPFYRCERVFPTRPCRYTRTLQNQETP
jgi:hypothetical protein